MVAGVPAVSSAPVRWPGRGAVAVLVLVAVAARIAVIGDPIVHVDEQFYFAMAHAWVRGALPYVDIWDRKPIGLFLLYAPAAALRDPLAGVVACQLLALAAAIAAALLVATIAGEAGWGRGALPAAMLYLLWLDLADGQGGQSPILYNPIMALAALVVLRGRGRRAGIAAMLLVGIAAQVKYTVVFEGAWFGLWLLWRDRQDGSVVDRLGYAAALVLVAAAPTLLVAGCYVARGQGDAWWFANGMSILLRRPAPWAERLGNLATCVAILVVPVGLAVAGWRQAPAATVTETETETAPRRFVQGWLAAALAGFAMFGTWFDHYTLPVLVPATIGAAAWFGIARWRWTVLAGAALAGQASVLTARANRGTPTEFAALVAAVGRGPGCLYVHSGPSMLYPFSGRCWVSRFVYPSHLTRTNESVAIGVDPAAEVHRLFGRRPAVVVMATPFRGEAPAIRLLVRRLLATDGYRLTTVLPLGRDRIAVYRRR